MRQQTLCKRQTPCIMRQSHEPRKLHYSRNEEEEEEEEGRRRRKKQKEEAEGRRRREKKKEEEEVRSRRSCEILWNTFTAETPPASRLIKV